MKKLIVVSIVLLFAVSASATLDWSLDFENGFTASSATPHVNNGDLLNPGDTTQEVHVKADPVSPQNNALIVQCVDANSPKSFLAYDDTPAWMRPEVDGKVTWRQYWADTGGADSLRKGVPWEISSGSLPEFSNNMIRAYMYKSATPRLIMYAYNNYPEAGYMSRTDVYLPSAAVAEGVWHDFEVSWINQGWVTENGVYKPTVELTVLVDGAEYFNGVMGWSAFSGSMLSIGCGHSGEWDNSEVPPLQKNSVYQIDQYGRGDMVDDFVFTPEPATLAILGLGAVLLRKRK